ncbi:hypothetical protein [Helicobacter pylori]|uniref:hypothetical protein n=1 Tax=Helicobacter pylori TaxID=210 RepID=UPI000345C711|nr:hypothetical protein [Helicobacter pylori]
MTIANSKHENFVESVENFDAKDSIADEKESQELTKEKEERKKSRNDFLYVLFKREKMPNIPSESVDFGSVFTIQGFKIRGGSFENKKLLAEEKDLLFIASMQTLVLRPFVEMKNDKNNKYVSTLEKAFKQFLIQKGVIKSSNSVEVFKLTAKEQEKIKENDSIILLDAQENLQKNLVVDKNLEDFLDKKNKVASIKKGEALLECLKAESVLLEHVLRKTNYKDFLSNFAFRGGAKKNEKEFSHPIRLDGINVKEAKLLQAVANVVTNTETQANHFKSFSDLVDKGSSVPKALSRTFLGYFHELNAVDQSLNSVDFGSSKMSLSFVEPSSLPMSRETFFDLEEKYRLLDGLSDSALQAVEEYKKKLLFAMHVDIMKNPENLRLTIDTTKNTMSKADAEKYTEAMLSDQLPSVKHGNMPISNKTELKEAKENLKEELSVLYRDLSPEEKEARIEEVLKNHVFERPRNTTETLQYITGEAENIRKDLATKRRELAVEKMLELEKHGFEKFEEEKPEQTKQVVGAKSLF